MLEQIDLEQNILGGLIINNSAILECDLVAEDFESDIHQKLFSKITGTIALNKSCDVSDLVTWADNNIPEIEKGYGGYAYVRDLVDSCVGTHSSVAGCSGQIKEIARKRKIRNALNSALEGLEETNSGEVLSFLARTLKEETDTTGIVSAKQVKREILERMQMPLNCYSTGIEPLDKAMGGGLYAGFTYGLCGAEKSGKTTMAHTISYNLKVPHLYIAMEMGMHQIEERNIARDLNINSLKFLNDPAKLKDPVESAPDRENVFYLDCPGADLDEILRHIGAAILKHDIKGFIVDYWQLVTGQQKGENEERHLRYVAQSLANFARKQGVFCLLLAQMNKDGQLFGGNGLRKACDQLYMIEYCNENIKSGRWLRMDASRYTFKGDVGSEDHPVIALNTKTGPHFEEYETEGRKL